MEVCAHKKVVFFLPVNILMVWSLAFLAARHTTVCLDTVMIETPLYKINVIMACANCAFYN